MSSIESPCRWRTTFVRPREEATGYRQFVGPHGGVRSLGLNAMRGNVFYSSGGGRRTAMAGVESGLEATCFADDVIVDFPSVAQAVSRIRRAFLADERSEPHVAAVELSASQARQGATVPLDVPVRRTCGECGGRGEAWAGACDRCAGTGAERKRCQFRVSVPAGVVSGMHLHFTFTPPHDPPTRIRLRVLVA